MNRFFWLTLSTVFTLGFIIIAMEGSTRTVMVLVVFVAYLVVMGMGVAFIHFQFFCPAACRILTSNRYVALSFDDGPDPDVTPAILDILRDAHVQAAFFCIGHRVLSNPEIVRRIHDEGHLLCNHSFHHGWWNNFLFGPWLLSEIRKCQVAVKEVAGQVPEWYRPPVGLTNPHLAYALNRLGLKAIGWDVRAFDRHACSAAPIIERICAKTRNGSIIALHDSGVSSVVQQAILEGIITGLQSRGFKFVRLDKLINAQEKERKKTNE